MTSLGHDTRIILGTTFLLLSRVRLTACVTGSTEYVSPIQKHVVGKTKKEILACAGTPRTESAHDGTMVLMYYKEAPLSESSTVVSKGSSRLTPRHACQAQVYLQNEHVIRLEYQSIPESIAAFDHSNQIFEPCAQ